MPMAENIIDTIAADLIRLEYDKNYSTLNQKLYTRTGILIEPYAKLHKLSNEELKSVVKGNSFFKFGSATIQTGLFTKHDKEVPTIEWEEPEAIREKYLKNPEKILNESASSSVLTQKVIQIISKERSKLEFKPISKKPKVGFDYPLEDRTQLYNKHLPGELEKYQREGRQESTLEKKFQKRVANGSEFHFSDGKVAYNLLSWFQCLQMAPNDIIVMHLQNNDFYDWLENKVKAPELSRICLLIKKRLQAGNLAQKGVKGELLSSINKTSLSNVIFETIIIPLLQKLKSNDQSKAEEAIDKLLILNDARVVEPLLNKIFESNSQIRRKIIMGLSKLEDKRVTPTLIKILKHTTDAQDRLLAVKTLSVLKDKRALKALRDAATNKDEVGKEAARVLSDMAKAK